MKPTLPPLGRYEIRPSILRAFRSKQAPHVGKKQLAKMQAKPKPRVP